MNMTSVQIMLLIVLGTLLLARMTQMVHILAVIMGLNLTAAPMAVNGVQAEPAIIQMAQYIVLINVQQAQQNTDVGVINDKNEHVDM
jgi:hypothetical protein